MSIRAKESTKMGTKDKIGTNNSKIEAFPWKARTSTRNMRAKENTKVGSKDKEGTKNSKI